MVRCWSSYREDSDCLGLTPPHLCLCRLRIQAHHLEPITQVKSIRQVLQFVEDCAVDSYVCIGTLVLLYVAMGVFRIPGQMVMHIFAGFSLGFTVGFPTALVANTITSCMLYHLGTLYTRGGSTEAWQYYAMKIDVFVMKVAQANFNCYVDANGQYYDKAKQAEIKASEWPPSCCARASVAIAMIDSTITYATYFCRP
eukprot:COSAG02_NODE_5525_length_4258_cov_9.409915_4_plen_198_part_00